MSALNAPLAAGLVAVASGALAYVFLMPLLSGERRAEQRRKALGQSRAVLAERGAAANRREQVAKSLKELEAKKDKTKVTLELRIARAGLDWSRRKYQIVSAVTAVGVALAAFLISHNVIDPEGGISCSRGEGRADACAVMTETRGTCETCFHQRD